MACDIQGILKKNKAKLNPTNLKELLRVFGEPEGSSLDKKLILNKILHTAIKARTDALNLAFKKVPKKLQIPISGIPITDADIEGKARGKRNAATSILAGSTLIIGRTRQALSDFITATTVKLNKLFQKSQTLIEYMESPAYATFVETASKEDVSVFQYLILNSKKLDEFFYGTEKNPPILGFMANTALGRSMFKGAITNNEDTYTDLFKYLLKRDENGKLSVDPLVLDAINLAVYNWQTTQARNTYTNDKREINSILGRDSKTDIAPHEWAILGRAGVVQALAIDSIGKEIFEALGFKAKTDVDGNLAKRLELALGEMGVAFMLENDILEQVRVDNEIFPAEKNIIFEDEENLTADYTVFIRVKDTDLIDRVSENNQKTDIAKDFFGIESYKKFPDSKSTDKTPIFMKRTRQKISEVILTLLKHMQKDKWEVKTAVTDKLLSVSESLRNSILGVVENVEAEHVTKRKGIEAQNNKITQTLEDLSVFIGRLKTPDAVFYMKYFVSRVGRIFMDNNTINPLQDDIIRHLIGLKRFNVNVNSEALRLQYKLAVVQSFGIKPGIDKQSLEKSLKDFESILEDNLAAIDALKSDTLTSAQEAIVKVALDGKEGIATFEALLSLRDYSETESFNTNLAIETDATTSGMAIGMMQSLLDGTDDMPATGVFIDGTTSSFPAWKGIVGNFDLYEKLAQTWATIVRTTAKKGTKKIRAQAQAIRGIVDSFMDTDGVVSEIGRKFSKSPLMVTNYGSNIANARASFGNTVLDQVYDKLAKADNPQIYYDYMATIVGSDLKIDPEVKPQDFILTKKQEAAFLETIDGIYGKALEIALTKRLGKFLKFRDTINKAFQVMFYVFETKFEIELAKKRKAVGHDLSIEEQEEVLESVRKFMPIVKGPLSKGLADGILIIKGGLVRQYVKEAKGEQQYSKPLKNTEGVKSLTSHVKHYRFKNPGAAATVSQIHNMDSAIQQAMLTTVEAMNIHDAGLYSLTDVNTGTNKYNQAFLDLNMSHSILQESWISYKRIMALAIKNKDIHAGLQAALQKNVFKPGKQELSVSEQRRAFELGFSTLLKEVTKNRDRFLLDNPSIRVGQAASPMEASVYSHQAKQSDLEKGIDRITGEILEHVKGSTSRDIDFDNFVELFGDTIDNNTMVPLFEQLINTGFKKDSTEHTARLKEILNNLVRLQGSIDLRVGEVDSESLGALRTFSDGTQDIHILGSASSIRNNAQLSTQEIYVHELVHAVTEYGIDSNPAIRSALKRLYTQAKKHFSYTDFLPDTMGPHTNAEIATAKETYDYIFNNTKGATGVRSTGSANPYLHEFVAYGLTNEAFIKKLSTISTRDKKKVATTLLELIVEWWNNLIGYVVDRVQGVDGLSSDKALRKLVDKMLSTNERNKIQLFKVFELFNGANQKLLNALSTFIFAPAAAYSKQEKPKHVPGRILHTLATLLDHRAYVEMGKVFKQINFNIGLTERSFIVKLVREMQGMTERNEVWHSLIRISKKVIDQARVHEAVNVAEHIGKRFHQKLTVEESAVLYKVYMKADIAALLNTAEEGKYNPTMLIKMLKTPSLLGTTIAEVEQQIKKEFKAQAKYYLAQTKGLGNLMTLGKDLAAGQMKNAYLIANLLNIDEKAPKDVKKAELLINELATLYALNNTSADQRAEAGRIHAREDVVDGMQNGVTNMLYLHNLNKEESLKLLFSGNKVHMEKGYTKETYDPNIDVKISPKIRHEVDPVTGAITEVNLEKILNKEGYIRLDDEPLPKDPLDTSKERRYLFVSRNNPTAPWVKAIVSLTAKKHKGTTIDSIYNDISSQTSYAEGKEAIATIDKAIRKDIARQFKGEKTTSSLLPLVDGRGKTVNYRYIMSDHIKETTMGRDNRMEYSLGRMFGSIKDKMNSEQINNEVLVNLKKDYDENYLDNVGDYVDIGPESTDPEIIEIYSLLPADMKRTMTEIWGAGKPIQVKSEFVNLIFGFRKLRLKDSKSILGTATRGLNQSVTWLMQNSFFPEAPNADIGKLWSEVVNIAKEMIVVKTGVILIPNFISNMMIMIVKGVPISTMGKHQTEALIELERYRKDLAARDILDRELKANIALTKDKRKRMEAELARLNTDMHINPVAVLIDEGVFQSIIEDLDFEEDIYTSRARLGTKIQEIANRFLPAFTVTTAKHMYLTKDTKPYQLLLKATQVSDFIARYTLYKHRVLHVPKDVKTTEELITYKKKAINEIVETFINYDVPTSKEMQWINDMGFLMFTKFYFRIQKVIWKLFKEQPATAIGSLLVQEMFGDVEDIPENILGPGILNRGNTFLDILDEATGLPIYELVT